MGSNNSPSAPRSNESVRSSGATAGKSAASMAKDFEKINQNKTLDDEAKQKNKQALVDSWAPPKASDLKLRADLKTIKDEAKAEKSEQERIRKQQKAIVEAERARRSNISTATKRNTIRTGSQGISSSRQSMPSTIAGGMPNQGVSTIVGG